MNSETEICSFTKKYVMYTKCHIKANFRISNKKENFSLPIFELQVPKFLNVYFHKIPEAFFTDDHTLIVNKEIYNLFEKYNITGYKGYAINLIKDSVTIHDFYAIITTTSSDSIDLYHSKYSSFSDYIIRLKELHLNYFSLPDVDIFRLKNYSKLIVISENLKNVLKNVKSLKIDEAFRWNDEILY